MMKYALLLSLVAVACADAPIEPPTTTYPTTTYGGKTGEDLQGLYILGSVADTLFANGMHFRVSATPANRPNYTITVKPAGLNGVNGSNLVATYGSVIHQGADDWFDGMKLDGIDGGQVKIVTAEPYGNTNTTSYVLQYRTGSNGNFGDWVDYCKDGAGAIPLQGTYNGDRFHGNSTDITWGCADAISYKCSVYWGYVAGNAGPGSEGWDYHQACTVMGNANYCRNGAVFTRELTPVVIEDYKAGYGMPDPTLTHPNPMPGGLDTYYFEAAYRAGNLPPVCLSKTRWAALPPNPCPGVLKDPRNDPEGDFCDDLTPTQIGLRGGLVINGSKLMDAPLRVWRSSSNQYVSTIRGYHDTGNIFEESVTPFGGYTEFISVDSMLLRNLPGTLDPVRDMVALYVYSSTTGDTVISSTAPSSSHTRGEFEGYAFRFQGTVNGLLSLVLYHQGDDYLTVLAGHQPIGFTPVAGQPLLGYALPAP